MIDVPVAAARTSFRVIHLLADRGSAGVTELATELDRSKSNVHDHLVTLERLGYVRKRDGRYELGLRFLDLGSRVRERSPAVRAGRAEVDDLASSSGETVCLVLEEDDEAVFAYRAGGVSHAPRVGERAPLHATAAGKAILSTRSRAAIDRLADERDLAPLTDRTITDEADLWRDVRSARDRGLAFERGEYDPERNAVAAPLTAPDGRTVGAITVAGPASRLNGKRLEEDVPGLVVSAAKSIELAMHEQ